MRRFPWRPTLALAIVFGASASCEAFVSLAHFDDGPSAAMDGGGPASDAAVDGRTDAGVDCPPLPGPTSVRIQTSTGTYCIDSTEVTNLQYGHFLSSIVPANATRPLGCERQNNFTPHANWPFPPGRNDYPVVSVDWCQAYAYCAWAGKRLCGQIGGGPLAVGPPEKDATQSQWFNACTGGDKNRIYSYGYSFVPSNCGGQVPGAAIVAVATQPQCVGGYPGIHDMNGNVWEWADVCETNAPNSLCRAYGGAFDSSQAELSCGFTGRAGGRTGMGAPNMGIRCCTDL
jgi:formylglycine-generating enzyme required for sulfatase activity